VLFPSPLHWPWPAAAPALLASLPAASRTLGECFQLFDVIHRITTRHDVISRITREVGDRVHKFAILRGNVPIIEG